MSVLSSETMEVLKFRGNVGVHIEGDFKQDIMNERDKMLARASPLTYKFLLKNLALIGWKRGILKLKACF
jgi:hypothetical protein